MPSVSLFALNPAEFSQAIAPPHDDLLARLAESLEDNSSFSSGDREEIAGATRLLLQYRCQEIATDWEIVATEFLLQSETEQHDLWELQGWKGRAFRALRLDELTSSAEPPFFKRLVDVNPDCLRYFTAADVAARILPEVTLRAEGPGSPDLDDEDEDGNESNAWTRAYQELGEALERVRADGLDAVLVIR